MAMKNSSSSALAGGSAPTIASLWLCTLCLTEPHHRRTDSSDSDSGPVQAMVRIETGKRNGVHPSGNTGRDSAE